jgi:hypothetical protein
MTSYTSLNFLSPLSKDAQINQRIKFSMEQLRIHTKDITCARNSTSNSGTHYTTVNHAKDKNILHRKKTLENIYTRPKNEFHMHNRVGVLMLWLIIQDHARLPQM